MAVQIKPRIYFFRLGGLPYWNVDYPGGTKEWCATYKGILELTKDWYGRMEEFGLALDADAAAAKATNYREITPHQQASLDAEDEFNMLEDEYPDWYLEYRWGDN